MTTWFRRRSSSPTPPSAPPTPGGTGGSGFGGVGGPPAGPQGPTSAGDRRDAVAGRGARDAATAVPPGSSGSSGGRGRPSRSTPSRTPSRTPAGTPARAPGAAGGTPEEQRFARVYADDRVGPMPYPHQAEPDVGAARSRVRALVDDLLPGGVDEGTGAALDPLIASWAEGWRARIDSEHADHHAVIDRLVGGARQQLAEAEAAHERDRRALEVARRDYEDARHALMTPVAEDPGPDARSGGGRPGRGSPGRGSPARGGGRGAALLGRLTGRGGPHPDDQQPHERRRDDQRDDDRRGGDRQDDGRTRDAERTADASAGARGPVDPPTRPVPRVSPSAPPPSRPGPDRS